MNIKRTGKITFYGATWWGDCLRAKAYLDSLGCDYDFINLETDETAAAKVVEINKGYQSIPTILFPDGKVLIEPSNQQLAEEIASLKENNLLICHKQMDKPVTT